MAKKADLPDETVRRIRHEAKSWRQAVLEARYGLTGRALRDLISGRTYGHVA